MHPRPDFDEAKRREFLDMIALGLSRHSAAKFVGCAPAQVAAHAARDSQFTREVERAEACFELTHLQNIARAAQKSPAAARWLLRWMRDRRAHDLPLPSAGQARTAPASRTRLPPLAADAAPRLPAP
jgi:hypothetical protein